MNGSFSKLRKIQAAAKAAWEARNFEKEEEQHLTLLQQAIQVCALVARSFVENRCLVRASALAYTTLMALIPLLAVGLSFVTAFLKGPEGEKRINDLIQTGIDKVAPQLGLVAKAGAQEDARRKVVDFITESINNISGGALGTTAVIILIFIGISLLANIETTLNDIWGVRKGRSWFDRVVLYWAAITLGPLLLMLALGLNIGAQFDTVRDLLGKNVFWIFGQFMSIFLVVVTFSIFYKLMPNTRVSWSSALVGGTVGGVLFHFNNSFSTVHLGAVVRNSQIYGSLAVVPIFLVGMYFSWAILLLGAQVSYAFQNRRAYRQAKMAESISQHDRELVAARVMAVVAKRFAQGVRPATAQELADIIGTSTRVVQRIVEPLLSRKLLIEVAGVETGYAPARPLSQISYQEILEAMRCQGATTTIRQDETRAQVQAELDRIRQAEKAAASAVTLEKYSS